MSEDVFGKCPSEEEEEERLGINRKQQAQNHSSESEEDRQKFLEPPRELPKRSYSLEPDMANGWKPKKKCKVNFKNVFPISYDQYLVDQIVRQLYKGKRKGKETLIYLGPRKSNSYLIHYNPYPNPYPLDKKQQQLFSSRNGIPLIIKLSQGSLQFQSDFQSGNLDVVIQRSPIQYDLFMRVDTNTRGHTNWYYFSVTNGEAIGSVEFNICNFRREKSLYQRGLKPYVCVRGGQWQQGGRNVRYEKTKLKYQFLLQEEDDEEFTRIEDQTHI